MEGHLSVVDAALFAGPRLSEHHMTAQVSKGCFAHVAHVFFVGLQGLCDQGFGTHLQDRFAEVVHATHQVPQQHACLFLFERNITPQESEELGIRQPGTNGFYFSTRWLLLLLEDLPAHSPYQGVSS